MNTQDYTIIKLDRDRKLNDIEPFKSTGLPSNSILHKTITGCGITTSEFKYTKRHSIIILPNVPVIKGKVKEHNAKCAPNEKILGVHKGKEIEHIEAYLASGAIYKKILTTPEGFLKKVVKAFENEEYMLNNFFLMYDECERLISDVSYRGEIAAPLNLFFRFKHKALVSATVLPFSDERFKDFTHYIIEPQYDFSKQLKLIATNNVLKSLKVYLSKLDAEHVSIFLNSTDTILSIIENLGIKDESHVYCAEDSVRKLRRKDYPHGKSELDCKKMEKYNFFTSRFFSAVDMVVNYKPHIIMITDVYLAPHSILDPFTEVIQISGRYRNGTKTLAHISNFNPHLTSMTVEQAHYHLSGCLKTYQTIVRLYHEETHPGSRETLKRVIDTMPEDKYYDEGELNSFMVDNYIHEERVKGYYQKFVNLLSAYEEHEKHFIVTHSNESYPYGDAERLRRGTNMSQQELNQVIAEQIHALTPRLDNYVLGGKEDLHDLRTSRPLIATAYDTLGLEGLNETGYKSAAIKRAIIAKEEEVQAKRLAASIYEAFGDDKSEYPEDEIAKRLQEVFTKNGVKKPVTIATIDKFYDNKRSTSNGVKVRKLKAKLFPGA